MKLDTVTRPFGCLRLAELWAKRSGAAGVRKCASGLLKDLLHAPVDAERVYRKAVGGGYSELLGELAVVVVVLGRVEEARDICRQAVAAGHPDPEPTLFDDAEELFRRIGGVATSLLNLGIRFWTSGRPGEAAPPTQEAVGIFQRLAGDNPDRYRDEPATSMETSVGVSTNSAGGRRPRHARGEATRLLA